MIEIELRDSIELGIDLDIWLEIGDSRIINQQSNVNLLSLYAFVKYVNFTIFEFNFDDRITTLYESKIYHYDSPSYSTFIRLNSTSWRACDCKLISKARSSWKNLPLSSWRFRRNSEASDSLRCNCSSRYRCRESILSVITLIKSPLQPDPVRADTGY